MLKNTLAALFLIAVSVPAYAAVPASWSITDDMLCVQSASWAMATQMQPDADGVSTPKDGYGETLNVFYFYLGRLNAQDGGKDWIENSKRDLMDNRKDESIYEAKFKECRDTLATRIRGK